MTPYREFKEVSVVNYISGVDDYGQIRQLGSTLTITNMAIRVANQYDVNNPLYVDSTHVGISEDKTLNTSQQIISDGETFNILYVIPSHRYYTYRLKKV